MALTAASDPRLDARRRRTVVWVVGLATLGLIFDGYDLVVYGAVVPTFLRDPSQIGPYLPRWPVRSAAMRWSACWSARCSPVPSATSSVVGR